MFAATALAVSASSGVANAQSGELGTLSADGISSVTGSLPGEMGSAELYGSLAGVLPSDSDELGSVQVVEQGTAAGSLDTTDSLLPEPTSGSLVELWAPIGTALGSAGGPTLKVSSSDGLAPLLLVGGAAATVAAGIAFAPQIEQALADAGIELPPLP